MTEHNYSSTISSGSDKTEIQAATSHSNSNSDKPSIENTAGKNAGSLSVEIKAAPLANNKQHIEDTQTSSAKPLDKDTSKEKVEYLSEDDEELEETVVADTKEKAKTSQPKSVTKKSTDSEDTKEEATKKNHQAKEDSKDHVSREESEKVIKKEAREEARAKIETDVESELDSAFDSPKQSQKNSKELSLPKSSAQKETEGESAEDQQFIGLRQKVVDLL